MAGRQPKRVKLWVSPGLWCTSGCAASGRRDERVCRIVPTDPTVLRTRFPASGWRIILGARKKFRLGPHVLAPRLGRAIVHFVGQGVRIKAVLTDQAFCYRNSTRFKETCFSLRIQHRTTRTYRPQTNGKTERFIRTLLQEWAYAELYLTNEARRRVLPDWLRYYNHDRPHTALGGSSPVPFLVNKVCGHYS